MKGNVMNTLGRLTLVAVLALGMCGGATAADYTAEQLMSLMDTNGDGKITMDEAPEELKAGFFSVDRNGDGGIDVTEAQVMADYNNQQATEQAARDTTPVR